MKLTREEVLHIATLARLGLSDAEVTQFQEQLSDILSHVEQLQAIDLSAISPTARAQAAQNVLRADVATPSLPRAAITANAPQAVEGCFKVPPILDVE